MRTRIVWRLVPSLVVLLAVTRGTIVMTILRAVVWLVMRTLHILVLVCGSISFWWILRAYQLHTEKELYDQYLIKYQYYQKYGRVRTKKGEETCSTLQPRGVKRLPIVTHLRTKWSLPIEICDEIAAFVTLAVRDYVAYWFHPISSNEDFPQDVKFLLADMFGAMVARVLEMDSSKALTLATKSIELARLHLGWFREAYAELSESHSHVFQGEESDEHLRRRQELLAAYAHKSPFLHPGCATMASSTARRQTTDTAEVLYLRHIATQILIQLKPELGQQYETNVLVSIAMNFMRESLIFKGLKPLFEYSQPRYANEMVVACLRSMLENKDSVGPLSPTSASSTAGAASIFAQGVNSTVSTATAGLGFAMSQLPTDLPNLKTLKLTKSFLYKASKRSSEHAEAAFQAVVDAVSTAASQATGSRNNSVDSSGMGLDGFDIDWPDSGAITSPRHVASPCSSSSSSSFVSSPPIPSSERKSHFASLFSLDDRISFPKSTRNSHSRTTKSKQARPITRNMTTTTGSSAPDGDVPSASSSSTTPMEDLKTIKANLESSLSSSLFKVGKKIRDLGGTGTSGQSPSHPQKTTTKMIKRPGNLLQKALQRRGGDQTASPSVSTPTSASSATTSSGSNSSTGTSGSTPATIQERLLALVDKTVAQYCKMYHERPEMRSSARSRELYELLSALEDVFMLGYHRPGEEGSSDDDAEADGGGDSLHGEGTPRGHSSARRRSEDGMDMELVDPEQLYWNYLAQDRTDTPFLNDHWRSIVANCPRCIDSESFYSTCGIQWILIALERGMLWEYVTALHLNRSLTDAFYDDDAVLRNGKQMERLLKSLFPLSKLRVTLEIPHVLGRKSELETQWAVPPTTTSRPSFAIQSVRILESVWEVERYVPIHGWTKTQDKRWHDLPSSEWIWENDWTLEPSTNGSDSESQGEAWEYSKTFEDGFHDKEKKFDSVRRRRWTRRRRHLPVVLTAVPSAVPTRAVVPPRTSSTSSNGSSSTRGRRSGVVTSPLTAVIRKKYKDDGESTHPVAAIAPVKKSMMTKRRSFSSDAMEATSLMSHLRAADATLTALLSPSKRGNKPRRGKPVPLARTPATAGSLSRTNSRLSKTDDEKEYGENDGDDMDDEEHTCFRCSAAIVATSRPPSSSSSATCQSCQQRVCAPCHAFFAFLVYPPPHETSAKSQVCRDCYDRLVARYKLPMEAHVAKYFVHKESSMMTEPVVMSMDPFAVLASMNQNPTVSSPSSAASGSGSSDNNEASNARYEVTVQRHDDDSGYAWSVLKTFHDFELLEKQLQEKWRKQDKKRARHWKGVDYTELETIQTPSFRALASSTAMAAATTNTSFSATSSSSPPPTSAGPPALVIYEKRRVVLEAYLQQLLACDTLGQSSIVQKFLQLPTNARLESPRRTSRSNASSSAAQQSDSAPDVASPTSGVTVTPPLRPSPSPSTLNASGTGVLMVESGKWKKGKWIAPETNTKETKMRLLQQLEVSLFAVLNEVFEFDGIGIVRRQLFAMTRSFIKAFLNASHFRMLEKHYLSLITDPKTMATNVYNFRMYMFPDPTVTPPPPPIVELSASEMQSLRKDCLDVILASFPSTIVSVFGETSCENAALKLHEFLQHEVFVKNLLFSICDEALPQLFPEIAPYTPPTRVKPSL